MQRHLRLARLGATPPSPDKKAIGHRRQCREEHAEFTTDIVPLTRREPRDHRCLHRAHGRHIVSPVADVSAWHNSKVIRQSLLAGPRLTKRSLPGGRLRIRVKHGHKAIREQKSVLLQTLGIVAQQSYREPISVQPLVVRLDVQKWSRQQFLRKCLFSE